MRTGPLLLLVGLLTSCASAQRFTLSAMAGPENVDAVDAAVECRTDDALALAQMEESAPQPTRRLFSHFLQAAIYTELGDTRRADALLDAATADPEMNPDGKTSRQEMQDAGDAIMEAIQEQRLESRGQRTCPSGSP